MDDPKPAAHHEAASPFDGDDEGDQLSSWAARWNSDTGTWNETATAESEDVQGLDQASSDEGIEGAPAGLTAPDAPVTDDLPDLPDTGAIDLPVEELGDPGFAGIEGAPAGDPEALVIIDAIADETDSAQTAASEADDTEPLAIAPEESGSDVTEPLAIASAGTGSIDTAPVGAVHDETAAADMTSPVDESAAPLPTPETAATTATTRIAGASVGGGARARATALLDEVRSLLPHLTTDGRDSAGSNAAAILAPLQEASDNPRNYEALRAIVTEAETNPRDIYAMMDLGRHSGEILALLDERDRLRAAVDAALAAGNAGKS